MTDHGVALHLKGDHSPSPMPSPCSSPKLTRMWFTERHFGQENNYENVNVQEMVEQLASTENLQEQADIIHFLYMKKFVQSIFLTIFDLLTV